MPSPIRQSSPNTTTTTPTRVSALPATSTTNEETNEDSAVTSPSVRSI